MRTFLIRRVLAAGLAALLAAPPGGSSPAQGVVRGLGVDAVEELNRAATGAVAPDIVVVLDVPDAVAAARLGASPDRLESEGDAFHVAVRAAYRSLAAERGWSLVDGDGDVEVVSKRVWSLVEPLLAG